MRITEPSPNHQHDYSGTRGKWCASQASRLRRINRRTQAGALMLSPVPPALVPGGHRQQPVCDVHGGVRSGRVAGVAGQCAGQTVPRSDLGEPDGGGRGSCCAQDACR